MPTLRYIMCWPHTNDVRNWIWDELTPTNLNINKKFSICFQAEILAFLIYRQEIRYAEKNKETKQRHECLPKKWVPYFVFGRRFQGETKGPCNVFLHVCSAMFIWLVYRDSETRF